MMLSKAQPSLAVADGSSILFSRSPLCSSSAKLVNDNHKDDESMLQEYLTYTPRRALTTSAGYYLGGGSGIGCLFEEVRVDLHHDHPTRHLSEGSFTASSNKNGSGNNHRRRRPALASFFRGLGIDPLYIYKCDATGRVVGERIPLHAPLTDQLDRLLVVSRYNDKYFRLICNATQPSST